MSIKNFGRLALISGLVFGVSAIAPVAVLAEEGLQPVAVEQDRSAEEEGIIIHGTVNEVTTISLNTDGLAFGFDYGEGKDAQTVGNVTYLTNAIGNWNIKAVSPNNGVLIGATQTGVTMGYELKLGEGSYIQPTSAGAELLTGNVSNTVADETVALLLKIPEEVTTEVVAQVYSDTISLVFTSGIPVE